MTTDRIKKGWISNSGIIKSVVGLFALARNDFADISMFRDELSFRLALELERVPSEETLRQRLDLIAKLNSRQTLLDYAMRDLLRKVESFGTVKIGKHKLIPLDIDVAALLNPDCKKEGIARTYHKIDGYAPIFAYLGSEGYMLANELRIGSQHSENGAVEFLRRCLEQVKALKIDLRQIVVRVDSGHDDQKFIKVLDEYGVKFIIKRNLRREPRERYLELGKQYGAKQPSRDGKNVWHYSWENVPIDNTDELFDAEEQSMRGAMTMVVAAIERQTNVKTGEVFLFPEIEIDSWWTNVDCTEEECIAGYHDHGTSEQFHSELKTDMNIEKLPSGKFATNALILNIAALAFNCLRIMGQRFLDKPQLLHREYKVARRRLRSVMQDLIYIAGHANLIDENHVHCFNQTQNDWLKILKLDKVKWENRALEKMLPHVVTCHLHDNDGSSDQHRRIGSGNVNWQHIKSLLMQAPRLKCIQSEVHPDLANASIKDLCSDMKFFALD